MCSTYTPTILNVNDDVSALYVKTRVLRNAGFTVREAATGGEALAEIEAGAPDLVLLDVNLPDISGIEVCRRIKAAPKTATLPVVQISAVFRDEPGRVSGLEGGADIYLAEPVGPELLVSTIRALLRFGQTHEGARKDAELAKTRAELVADRLRRLLTISTALSEAVTTEEVLDTIADRMMAATGAATGFVAILSENGSEILSARIRGYPEASAARLRRFSLDAPLPAADAVRTGAGVFVEDVSEHPRYGPLAEIKAAVPARTLAAVPLVGQARVIGALGLRFPSRATFDDDYREFLTAIGRECGQALERARLYDAERRLREELEQEMVARKGMERSLRESEERYRKLVDIMPTAVYTCDATGKITFYNDRAAAIWGREPDATDRYCGSLRLFHPDGRLLSHEETPMAAAIAQGREFRNEEAIVEQPDRTRLHVLVNVVPIRDETGAVVGALNTGIDVTALKRAEDRLQTANRRLAFLSESASGLLAAEDPLELIQRMYERLHDLTGIEVSFHYAAEGSGSLRLAASYGVPEETVASYGQLALGQAVCGTVAAERRAMILDRVQEGSGEGAAGLRALGITAYACFPLLSRGRLLGTLSFGLRSRDAFAEDEIALLQSVADEVAVALGRKASAEERERLVRELRESRDLLAKTQEIARAGSFELDLKTNRGTWSEALERLYGFGPQQDGIALESWADLLLPEDRERALAEVAATIESGIRSSQFRIRRRDTGEVRWLEARARVLRDDAGVPVRMVGFNIDITEQKQAEEKLRQRTEALHDSEQRYRAVFEGAAIGIGRVSFADARWIEVNEAFCRMLGYTREEMQATGWPEITYPDDIALDLVPFRRMAAGELDSYTVEKRFVHKLGHTVWARLTLSLMRDAAGRPDYEIAVIENITQRKQAEAALRESEERYRALFDSMQESFAVAEIVCDAAGEPADWRYLEVNPAFERMFGRRREDVVGRTYRELFPDAAWEYWVAGLGRVALTGEPAHLDQYDAKSRKHYESIAYRPHPGHVAAIFTDVTDRKQAEERLRQTQKLESVGLLAGGIAHDFNNLLTGIMGNASMILDEVDAGPAENIREIVSSAEKAAHLTRQLLAYSGKGQFIVQDLDVSETVHDISGLVQFSIPKSVDLAVSVQKRLPLVRMDPSQLQQILMNLVINAGEAIGEGNPGRVVVATSLAHVEEPFVDALGQEIAPGRYVCIEVSDTGGGIDEQKRPKIFDPFFTTKFTGRGLGLAAVAGIVRSQKGAITLESATGRGTTFRVLLPPSHFRSRAQEARQEAEGSTTVLVVDDDDSVRDFIRAVFQRQGYRVLVAADGKDALAVLERERGNIEALVLDVVMPVMGANELLPEVKARQPEAKVLLTSGYSESEARRLCAAWPGAAFIQKPYTARQILSALEELLGITAE